MTRELSKSQGEANNVLFVRFLESTNPFATNGFRQLL